MEVHTVVQWLGARRSAGDREPLKKIHNGKEGLLPAATSTGLMMANVTLQEVTGSAEFKCVCWCWVN